MPRTRRIVVEQPHDGRSPIWHFVDPKYRNRGETASDWVPIVCGGGIVFAGGIMSGTSDCPDCLAGRISPDYADDLEASR